MVLEGFNNIDSYTLFAVVIGIITLSAWLTRIKLSVDRNDRCITRLENKIDSQNIKIETVKNSLDVDIKQINVDLASIKQNVNESVNIHKEIRDEVKDTRGFFTDWIQRVEDLLRDQRAGSIHLPQSHDNVDKRLDIIEKLLMKYITKTESTEMK